jgi:actin-related protein
MAQGIFKLKISSYTKMGWAGNEEPLYDIPTIIGDYSMVTYNG